MKAINSSFGSFDQFKKDFSHSSKNKDNAGWSWLIVRNRRLKITTTTGQNNPFMNTMPEDERGFPVLCLDLWDHAGGTKYQNRKDDYLDAFWNILNWNTVNKRFERANSR
jgi:Fe-Mn family superoxide dismutase